MPLYLGLIEGPVERSTAAIRKAADTHWTDHGDAWTEAEASVYDAAASLLSGGDVDLPLPDRASGAMIERADALTWSVPGAKINLWANGTLRVDPHGQGTNTAALARAALSAAGWGR